MKKGMTKYKEKNPDIGYEKKLRRYKKTVAALTLIGCVVFGGFLVAAKYMQSTPKQDTVLAKEFYFTSDLLDGETHEITALDNDGKGNYTASVTFQLMNHEDELRYSGVEIACSVSVENTTNTNAAESNISIKDANGDVINGQKPDQGIKLDGGKISDQSITVSGLQPGESYFVTAATSNTYEKTLTATIKVNSIDNKVYCHLSDEGAYINVTVWTDDYAGDINLAYPAGLIPDNTDSWMADWSRGSAEKTIKDNQNGNMGANASHVFRFFKENAEKTYSVSSSASNNERTVTIE